MSQLNHSFIVLCSSPPTPVLIETGALAADVLVEKLATAIQNLEDSRQQPPAPAQPPAPTPAQPAAVQEALYPDSVDEDLYGTQNVVQQSENVEPSSSPVTHPWNRPSPHQVDSAGSAAVDGIPDVTRLIVPTAQTSADGPVIEELN